MGQGQERRKSGRDAKDVVAAINAVRLLRRLRLWPVHAAS